ncbi:MAG: twin-arginine translocase TatA/TatE family subunit [Thermoleophilia bacterium]
MGELSPVHIAIVLAIVLLVFGPKKLPEMGRSLGKGIREFKQATSGLKDEFSLGLDGNPVAPAATPVTPAATVVTPAAGDETAAATTPAAVSVANATVTATPPSVFVDANGNEYRLAAVAPAGDSDPEPLADSGSAAPNQTPDAPSNQAII